MMISSQMPLTAGKPEHRWWILAVLATAQLMVALDATVVSIALPHAQATLHFSSADRQQIGASIGTALLNSIAAGAAASFITAHATGAAPSRVLVAQAAVHSYTVAFWAGAAILTAAALAVAPLLRPGLAELGAMPRSDIRPRRGTTDRHTQPVRSVFARPPSGHEQHLDPQAPCQPPGSSVDRSVAEIATDGAPACVESSGAS